MLIGILVIYLAILQGLNQYLTSGMPPSYGKFPTIDVMIKSTLIPVGVSVLFVIGVVSWLGWWKDIFCETMRLPRWTWVFPVLLLLSILVVTNYSQLGRVDNSMLLTMIASVLVIGFGEEVMFRGIVLKVMRAGKRTELKAALLTALIFGGVHITNVFSEGPGAFLQAAVVCSSGIFFYVVRRVSGGLLLPILLHAGWDFSLFSGNMGINPESNDLGVIAIVTNIVLLIIVLAKWKSIWLTDEVVPE